MRALLWKKLLRGGEGGAQAACGPGSDPCAAPGRQQAAGSSLPASPAHAHHGCTSCIWRRVLSSFSMPRSSIACTWLRCVLVRASRAAAKPCSVCSSGGATCATAGTCCSERASEANPNITSRRRALSCSSQRSKVTSSCCPCCMGASSAAGSSLLSAAVSAAHWLQIGSSSCAVTCRRGTPAEGRMSTSPARPAARSSCPERLSPAGAVRCGERPARRQAPAARACSNTRWSAARRLEASSFSVWCSAR